MTQYRASAFLIMPFENSLEWLRDAVVEAGGAAGVRVERADDIFGPGIVIEQITKRIREADTIIAVCTGQNPNVFFELGVADQWHWPIILAEASEDLPFDVHHYRALIYGGLDVDALRRQLEAAINSAIQGGRKDVPSARATDVPPRTDPRVLGQFMSQVHVWGLEREGSLEHIPIDVAYLVQDIRSSTEQGARPMVSEFPKRIGVMANGDGVLSEGERFGIVQRNYDANSGQLYLALTTKGEALARAYDAFVKATEEVRPISAAPDESIILLEPVDGAVVEGDVSVRGYARTFEANVVIQDQRSDGSWVTVGVTTAKGMAEDHTAFSTTVVLSAGQHRLRVGDFSPRDGEWSGAEIGITVL